MGSGKNFYWESTDRDYGLGKMIDAFISWSRSELEGQDPKVTMSLALVFDELYMNALLHGYSKNPSSFWVSVKVYVQKNELVAIYRDRAMRFDPLSSHKENHKKLPLGPIEEIPIGGLGIHLISRFVDHISYNFVDSCNEIRVVKKLQSTAKSN